MADKKFQPQTAEIPTSQPRGRLRFTGFELTRNPHGECTVEVELEWVQGTRIVGRASGQSSATLDLRLAAEAALKAIDTFAEGAISLELIGVKHVRAFDANVVIVAVQNRLAEGPRRFLGSALVESDPVHGAVIAVLGATNRLLGNVIAMR
jgi:hypothetical protein